MLPGLAEKQTKLLKNLKKSTIWNLFAIVLAAAVIFYASSADFWFLSQVSGQNQRALYNGGATTLASTSADNQTQKTALTSAVAVVKGLLVPQLQKTYFELPANNFTEQSFKFDQGLLAGGGKIIFHDSAASSVSGSSTSFLNVRQLAGINSGSVI